MNFGSKDLLNYALTISVLVITFFIGWILYYLVSMMKEMKKVSNEFVNVIKKFNATLEEAKDKLYHLATIIPIALRGVEKVLEMVASRRAAKNKKNP